MQACAIEPEVRYFRTSKSDLSRVVRSRPLVKRNEDDGYEGGTCQEIVRSRDAQCDIEKSRAINKYCSVNCNHLSFCYVVEQISCDTRLLPLQELKSSGIYAFDVMSTERCAKLMVASMANNLDECH